MSARWISAAMAAAAVAVAIVLLFATMAHAHEMGQFKHRDFLFGHKIGDPNPGQINCCRYTGGGDCRMVEERDVKAVPGGYLYSDGEFVPAHETTVSPQDDDGEYRHWRCHNPNQPSHCAFVPPSGS